MPAARLTRNESRALTRLRLIEAGEAVCAEKGFHASSVEDISERAGYSSGAFYSNFKNKEALFLAIFDARNEELVRDLTLLVEEASSPAEVFEGIRRRALSRANRPSATALSLEFILFSLRKPKLRQALAARERALQEAFGRLARAYEEELEVNLPASPAEIALIVLGLDAGL